MPGVGSVRRRPMPAQTATSPERQAAQQERLALPPLPTTTIGSFPQTTAMRQARAAFRAGRSTRAGYEAAMRAEIRAVIDDAGSDSGSTCWSTASPSATTWCSTSPSSSTGSLFTQHGWVQSYGTRYVRPPIIVGDVVPPGADDGASGRPTRSP